MPQDAPPHDETVRMRRRTSRPARPAAARQPPGCRDEPDTRPRPGAPALGAPARRRRRPGRSADDWMHRGVRPPDPRRLPADAGDLEQPDVVDAAETGHRRRSARRRRAARRRPARPWWRRRAVLVPAGAVAGPGRRLRRRPAAAQGSIPRSTVVAGVDIGGLSPAAAPRARSRTTSRPARAADRTVVADDVKSALSPAAAGLSLDVPAPSTPPTTSR